MGTGYRSTRYACNKLRSLRLRLFHGAAFAPQVIGKRGYEYLLGKESGLNSIRVFLNRLGLEASQEEMKRILEVVKEEANILKGTISEVEFEFIARKIIKNKM